MLLTVRDVTTFLTAAAVCVCSGVVAFAQVSVSPTAVTLDRPEATQQLLITEQAGAVRRDHTRTAEYTVANPAIARVDAEGLVHPLTDGVTQVTIKQGTNVLTVPVTVTGLKQPVPVSFRYEVQPILTKT